MKYFIKESGFVEDRRNDAKYLAYLIRHKYNVYKGGRVLGEDRLTLLKHDWSKFKPSIWVPYRDHFYKDLQPQTYEDFRKAVKAHATAEAHHDYKYNNPTSTIVPNAENYADWWSTSKESYNSKFPDIKTWMSNNKIKYLEKTSERSEFKKLQKNKVALTSEERGKVMARKAVWHHGPNGEETPAVWKSINKAGKVTFICHTHRAYNTAPTLEGAISKYHKFIKGTA